MGEPRHWHLIFYDISDDTRRARVHDLLRRWGRPLQFSIFYIRCTARELARLRFELSQLVEDTDRLAVVRLCGQCAQNVTLQGDTLAALPDDAPPFHIV